MNTPLAIGLYTATFSKDGNYVALGDFSKAVFLWRPMSGWVRPLLGHVGEVRSVAFSPDSTLLLSAAADGVVKVWDVKRQELLETTTVQEGPVSWYSTSFSPKGDQALIGGTDDSAKILDMKQERRNPLEIAALLSCRVAWKVVDTELIPTQSQIKNCPAQ
jgi:WD40 repeat protein